MGDDAAAAQDQEVRHRLAEIGPLGDGEHVVAAFGGRDCDEVLVAQPRRGDQDRPRHRDFVERELAHDAARRIGNIRQPFGQFDAGAHFDGARKPADDDVEDADLIFGHAAGRAQEQIRQTRQDLDALLARATHHRCFEIAQQRADRTHPATPLKPNTVMLTHKNDHRVSADAETRRWSSLRKGGLHGTSRRTK
jgi:hypothetical protein